MSAIVSVPEGVVPVHGPVPSTLYRSRYSTMSGPPFRSGFVHVTVTLSVVPAVVVTVGWAGLPGFSFASVTFTVTAIVSVPPRRRRPSPSTCSSAFVSWSSAASVLICRVVPLNANDPASVPSSVYVSGSSSPSIAAGITAPMAVSAAVFSNTSRITLASSKTGGSFEPV